MACNSYNSGPGLSFSRQGTAVSDLFFSDLNRDALQDGIRYKVYQSSPEKYVIDRQDDTELLLVMRSIFLQNAKNAVDHVVEQVRDLNQAVLNYCVPEILQQIRMQAYFVQDTAQLPRPLERSQCVSSAGRRSLSRATLG